MLDGTATIAIPERVTVYVHAVDAARDTKQFVAQRLWHHAENITCFRCGEMGHYKVNCHRWKIKLCARHASGACGDSAQCSYAHSPSELRRPWMSKCVRVVKAGNTVRILGCGQVGGHTFRMCPYGGMPPS